MPKVKLTLTIDEDLLVSAKAVAKQRHTSLSGMIEQLLAGAGVVKGQDAPVTESVALRLKGIAKSKLGKKTDKQIREMMYRDRYGI
ncbi:hypothetical protein GCM10023187_29230 [Nibrella viscosa]|uniref:Ribbon-helix-helix protein CopG domain-containing protein n=1 Tax=Nibrella viscosa TaxID=1084524 RepID=A0ABP8KJI8_9BACT